MTAPGTNNGSGHSRPPRLSGAAFLDPRLAPDFEPQRYPWADGSAAPPPGASGRDDQVRIEFCAVYYHLNRLHARLEAWRRQGGGPSSAERELMEEIERRLRHRDALEDQYAPFGVIAEPVPIDGFTVNIHFTFGDHNILREERTRLVSSTALIVFPEEGGPVSIFPRTTR